MSSEHSVKELSFIYYFLFSHNSCDCCAISDGDVDEDKVGLKVEDGEGKKEEDDNNLEVSDEDVDRTMATKKRTCPRIPRRKCPRTLALSRESWTATTFFP